MVFLYFNVVEPSAVKFECQGISRPSSSTAVRVGSAGRVERSLQLARKKELADEIPTRCNSAGAEMISLGNVARSRFEICKYHNQ